MTTGQYIKNALLYFIKLLLFIIIIYALLNVTGYTPVSAGAFLEQMIGTTKGVLFLGVLLVWSAVYPSIGFVKRTVEADIVRDREKIILALSGGGYTMTREEPGAVMTFRASSMFKRIWLAFGDKVTVTADGEGSIVVSGVRKEAVQAEFRIGTAVRKEEL